MRHETYFKEKNKKGKKTEESKPGSFEAYEDFNNESVGELIAKRRQETEELLRRQREKIKKLKRLEEAGEPLVRK